MTVSALARVASEVAQDLHSQPVPRLRDEAQRLMDHPSGFLALSSRNEVFSIAGQRGFIAYREQGRLQHTGGRA